MPTKENCDITWQSVSEFRTADVTGIVSSATSEMMQPARRGCSENSSPALFGAVLFVLLVEPLLERGEIFEHGGGVHFFLAG